MQAEHSDSNNAEYTTIDNDEIHHFSKDSDHWWDLNGPFKPLHHLNPVRMDYIKQQICQHFEKDFYEDLDDITCLDIGCGGGLASEALAEMGAQVTGIDGDANAINVARNHAETSELKINYIHGEANTIKEQYDVVLALEVIEHVSDIDLFVRDCCNRLKPGGLLILSTLNRTAKSYALGIVAAEYILRWVPKGTHSWQKFVKPSEIATLGRKYNLTPQNITGLIYNPIKNEFSLSKTNLDVNYIMSLSSSV